MAFHLGMRRFYHRPLGTVNAWRSSTFTTSNGELEIAMPPIRGIAAMLGGVVLGCRLALLMATASCAVPRRGVSAELAGFVVTISRL